MGRNMLALKGRYQLAQARQDTLALKGRNQKIEIMFYYKLVPKSKSAQVRFLFLSFFLKKKKQKFKAKAGMVGVNYSLLMSIIPCQFFLLTLTFP